MEITERKPTTLVWVLAILIGLGLAGGFYWNHNRRLTVRIDQEEQRADSLLSVKLQLEGDIRELNSQLVTATDDKAYLNDRNSNLHSQLNRRNQAVSKLRQQNAGQTRSIQDVNRQLNQLVIARDSLNNQMVAMHDKINWQNQANEQLRREQNAFRQKQRVLESQVLTMVPASIITGDAFRVEVSKSNKKVTAKAKKVNTMTISLDLPAMLKLEGIQEVYLSLTDGQQKPMMPSLHTATVTLPDANEVIPVHATQTVNFARNPQRILFTLNPEITTKPGTYRASIFTKEAYLGSVEFRLRDSFWFF